MRIIQGDAAGAVVKVPKGWAVRPTPERVRQAIFNSLAERVHGASVLDLFSGTAALGLECLSRGARHVLSVESSPRHAAIIRQNLLRSRLPEDRYQIRVQDVFKVLAELSRAGQTFDLVLADPPFGEKNVAARSNSLAQALLDDAHLPQLLEASGLFVLGHTKRDTLTLTSSWAEVKVLRHGDSTMRVLKLSTDPKYDLEKQV